MYYMIITNGLLVQYAVHSLLKLLIVGAHSIFTVFETAGKQGTAQRQFPQLERNKAIYKWTQACEEGQ